MKALKVTISGSFRIAGDEIKDYSGLTGIIPYQDEEIATLHIRKRYSRMWIMNGKFSDRLKSVRECFVDDMQEVDADFSFVGKDIRTLTQEEMQDLATAKDLRAIPLYKKTSEREMRTIAYAAYSEQVLKEKILYKEVGFNLMKQPPIIVNDSAWRKDTTKKMSIEESLDAEAAELGGLKKTSLTRVELEQLAKQQNVQYHPNISDDKLYARIYG